MSRKSFLAWYFLFLVSLPCLGFVTFMAITVGEDDISLWIMSYATMLNLFIGAITAATNFCAPESLA